MLNLDALTATHQTFFGDPPNFHWWPIKLNSNAGDAWLDSGFIMPKLKGRWNVFSRRLIHSCNGLIL